MSKTIRELIDDARASGDWDAVADWCESFDWSQAEEIPVGEYLLERAVWQRDSGESQISEAVAAALAGGATWDRIAEILGTSTPEARQRYERSVERLGIGPGQ